MSKTVITQEQMDRYKKTASLIAHAKMDNPEKYPELFKKKFKSQTEFSVRQWEDYGMLLLPNINIFGEERFESVNGEHFIPYKCVSIYFGFLFYGLVFRFGFLYKKVESFDDQIEYHEDYWDNYDLFMDSIADKFIVEAPKKKAKKKEIKKDSAKFVNNKTKKSTKPKKNGKV